ncbi:MAG TPA: hypothetical protein VH722_04240 [Alphaproteobacteria bacterium]|jgi:hypothetical protein|nr:hypothetical protein [Alphaproteobacteria bacterium]
MDAHPQMSTNDKVLTLLAEYSSLRAEILQRNSTFNQYCVISVPASVAAVSFAYTAFPPAGILLFLIIGVLLYVVFRIIEFDTLAAAARVRTLETVLNEMAGQRLVTWENDCGLNTVGYRHRFRYIFDPIIGFLGSLMNSNSAASRTSRPAEEPAD